MLDGKLAISQTLPRTGFMAVILLRQSVAFPNIVTFFASTLDFITCRKREHEKDTSREIGTLQFIKPHSGPGIIHFKATLKWDFLSLISSSNKSVPPLLMPTLTVWICLDIEILRCMQCYRLACSFYEVDLKHIHSIVNSSASCGTILRVANFSTGHKNSSSY